MHSWSFLVKKAVLRATIWTLSITPGFPAGSDSKESGCNEGDPGSIPGSERFPGEGNGYPLQYFLPWKFRGQRSLATVHRVTKNQTIKKAECLGIDDFKLWCWRKLLRVPWTARKSTVNIHWKNWNWNWSFNTWAAWCKELTHWKRPWCWERLRAGDGGNRGWDGWMASLKQWTWIWANFGRQ